MSRDQRTQGRVEAARKFSRKGKFKKAIEICERELEINPEHVLLNAFYATMLGDDAHFVTGAARAKIMKKVVKILSVQVRRLSGLSYLDRRFVRNEYYYHSGQFDKQYRLGVELVAGGDKAAYFPQSVGASEMALRYYKKGQIGVARSWARKAIKAGDKFYKKRDKRSFSNIVYFYSKALMVLGEEKRARELFLEYYCFEEKERFLGEIIGIG